MDGFDERIVAAIRQLIDANAGAKAEIVAGTEVLQRGLVQLVAGVAPSDAIKAIPLSSRREATQGAFKRMVEARHELRLQAIGVCSDEGMSMREIAEIWGVSRQRVAQSLAELRQRREADSLSPIAGPGR